MPPVWVANWRIRPLQRACLEAMTSCCGHDGKRRPAFTNDASFGRRCLVVSRAPAAPTSTSPRVALLDPFGKPRQVCQGEPRTELSISLCRPCVRAMQCRRALRIGVVTAMLSRKKRRRMMYTASEGSNPAGNQEHFSILTADSALLAPIPELHEFEQYLCC